VNERSGLEALEEATRAVESDPHAGQSLLLYALVKTLSTGKGGHAYTLSKLRDMNEGSRALAYGLMELMARGHNETPQWQLNVARMDAAMRGRPRAEL
jgi:hypothetical protein